MPAPPACTTRTSSPRRRSAGTSEAKGSSPRITSSRLSAPPPGSDTSTPALDEARMFAEAVRSFFPGKLPAYNCSPSFNWKRHLDDDTIARFQKELAAMGYKFQFITLAGFHALNASMFELAKGYAEE